MSFTFSLYAAAAGSGTRTGSTRVIRHLSHAHATTCTTSSSRTTLVAFHLTPRLSASASRFRSRSVFSSSLGVVQPQPWTTMTSTATRIPSLLFSSSTTTNTDDTNEKININEELVQEFASSYHAPVMYRECIDALLKNSHNDIQKKGKKNKYKNKHTNTNKVQNHNEPHHNNDNQQQLQQPRKYKVFIDGTLGGGGHSLCLLQSLSPGDILIGCDVDPSALATASTRLLEYLVRNGNGDGKDEGQSEEKSQSPNKPIFIPVQSNFCDLKDNVKDLRHPLTGDLLFYRDNDHDNDDFIGVDGILLDLGVSSHQIDNAERGFAFMKEGPLDMRMWGGEWDNQDDDNDDTSASSSAANNHDNDTHGNVANFDYIQNKNLTRGGMTAADICNEFTQDEITKILRVYSDEPRARKISQAIVDARPLSTTADLRNAVASVTPEFARKGRRMGRQATLARVFQALRIVVNEEDVVLKEALEDMAPALIQTGGRLVVLTYHSMEDRAAKRVMRDGEVDGLRAKYVEKDIYGNEIDGDGNRILKPWKVLGKKQRASKDEVEVNSRARSAYLRVAERQQQ